MDTKMTHASRAELANAIRRRYRSAASKEKRRILEEFVAATGYHEKSAIRVLNSEPAPRRRQTRRRSSIYDEAARSALIVLWGGFRSGLRQTSTSFAAHPVACFGAPWAPEARCGDPSEDLGDECSHNRPTIADAQERVALAKASSR